MSPPLLDRWWARARAMILAAALAGPMFASPLLAGQAPTGPAPAGPDAIPEACRSKTDGCQVCKLEGGKIVACSLPGIACAKGDWHCNEPAAVPPLPEVPQGTPPAAPNAPAAAPATEPAREATPAPATVPPPAPTP